MGMHAWKEVVTHVAVGRSNLQRPGQPAPPQLEDSTVPVRLLLN